MKLKLTAFYCIVNPDGVMLIFDSSHYKRDAIRSFLRNSGTRTWREYLQMGYKCLKFKPSIV